MARSAPKSLHLPPESVLNHIVDVHCHPTDAVSISPESMRNLKITICAMSSRKSDQSLVSALARAYPTKVIPCFGYHPWFSHLISLDASISREDHYRRLFPLHNSNPDVWRRLLESFPDPVPLSEMIDELKANLESFPNAMLGEVGLDRVFRVSYNYFASPRELTPYTVPIEHQMAILEAQIDLAVQLGRNISLHSVKSQLNTKDLLDMQKKKHGTKWNKISIDLHSCGLSTQMWRDIEKKHNNVFISLSTVINSRSPNHIALIKECSSNRILVESDYNDVDFCTEQTWSMLQTIADIKGWIIEQTWEEEAGAVDTWGVVRRLEDNWRRFSAGNHPSWSAKQEPCRKHTVTA